MDTLQAILYIPGNFVKRCELMSCLDEVRCVNGVGCPCPDEYLTFDSKRIITIHIDECSVNGGSCQQVCTNIPGSYKCSCLPGYLYNDINDACEGELI